MIDGVVANTIAIIVKLYNEDFQYYKGFKKIDWIDINTWGFEECNCASPDYINTYFNQKRFFDNFIYMDWAKEAVNYLKYFYDITIVSSGYSPNLMAKKIWIKNHLPFCKFIGVNLKEFKDKSHIDMSDGIFIDDSSANLETSNAKIRICFGDIYPWNKEWPGKRCNNWTDVRLYLEEVDGQRIVS